MHTKKLSAPQKCALSLLSYGAADFYQLARVGAPGTTTKKLVSLGLAEEIGHRLTGREWIITPAGREALQLGRYKVQNAITR